MTSTRPTSMGVIKQLTTNNAPASTSTTTSTTTSTVLPENKMRDSSPNNQKNPQTTTVQPQPQTTTTRLKERNPVPENKFQLQPTKGVTKFHTPPTSQLHNPLIIQDSSSSLTRQKTASFGQEESSRKSLDSFETENRKIKVQRSSQKRLSELSQEDFTPISSLVEQNSSFTIKAKVIKKTEMRSYDKKGTPCQVFSIEIVDSHGGEIQGSFFGDVALKFFDTVQQDRVYIFSGGTVKLSNSKFQT